MYMYMYVYFTLIDTGTCTCIYKIFGSEFVLYTLNHSSILALALALALRSF